MAVPMLEALGHSREEALDMLMHDKERTLSLGITVRHLLRTLGTEWGRECIHPDVWLSDGKEEPEVFWVASVINIPPLVLWIVH
jgi:hypothetical protein